MNQNESGWSEMDDAAITHVLTYGYPSADDPIHQKWKEQGVSAGLPEKVATWNDTTRTESETK